jgi:hypothetical protein
VWWQSTVDSDTWGRDAHKSQATHSTVGSKHFGWQVTINSDTWGREAHKPGDNKVRQPFTQTGNNKKATKDNDETVQTVTTDTQAKKLCTSQLPVYRKESDRGCGRQLGGLVASDGQLVHLGSRSTAQAKQQTQRLNPNTLVGK